MLWVTVEKSRYQHAHLTNWSSFRITLVLFTILVRVNNPWPNTFFFFWKFKVVTWFLCSCSPINFEMEQKGQPQVNKFYQLSRCTSSPFDPKAENTWSLSPFQQRMQWAWELHTFTFTYLPILCFTQFLQYTHLRSLQNSKMVQNYKNTAKSWRHCTNE